MQGRILDDDGTSPLPAVRILVAGTSTGAISNTSGEYRLRLAPGTYTLTVNYVGYQEHKQQIVVGRQALVVPDIVLRSRETTLNEVVISSKAENPAHRIMRRVIASKQLNHIERFEAYEYQKFSRIVLSLDNLAEEELDKPLLRGAKELILREGLDSLNTNDSAGRRYAVPIFLSESVSKVYFKRPAKRREEIEASRQQSTLTVDIPLINSLISTVDVYRNNIRTPGKDFLSPIADGAFANYDYFIIKTERLRNDTLYTIELFPLSKYDPAFRGTLVISSHDWAVKSCDLTMNQRPGINYVEGLRYRQVFEREDGQWLPRITEVDIDFSDILGNGKGAHARSVVHYSQYVLNTPRPDPFFRNTSIEMLAGATTQPDSFWEERRMIPLTTNEQLAGRAIDTLQRTPIWRTYNLIAEFVTGGFRRYGNVDVGPIARVIGFNPVEGLRLQGGVYTNSRFSNRWALGGYAAYGFKDERLKYNVDVSYALQLRPRLEIGLSRTQDVEQTGFQNYHIEGVGLLYSLMARVPLRQLSYFSNNQLRLNYDLANGVSIGSTLTTRYYEPSFELPFDDNPETGPRSTYRTTEWGSWARLSIRERYILREGKKVYQGSPLPILYAEYWKGMDKLGGEFNYNHLRFTLTNRYRTGRFGNLVFVAQAGKIWGTVPYANLYVFRGSQSYQIDRIGKGNDFARSMFTRHNWTAYYDQPGFNLLSFFEFVADQYAIVAVDHHLQGWLIRKIPLLRNTEWKEIIRLRVGYGSLRPENRQFNLEGRQPQVLVQAPSARPYVEAGFGIENIFKFAEVDFIWRLNYRDPIAPNGLTDPFGFNFGLRFNARLQF